MKRLWTFKYDREVVAAAKIFFKLLAFFIGFLALPYSIVTVKAI